MTEPTTFSWQWRYGYKFSEKVIKLLEEVDSRNFYVINGQLPYIVQVLFAMFTIYYLIEELLEIRTHGCVYFANAGIYFLYSLTRISAIKKKDLNVKALYSLFLNKFLQTII